MIESLKFLIVDDSEQMRRTIRAMLMAYGASRIIMEDNGADAFRVAKETWPDFIITDLSMQPVNGIELTRALRRDPKSFNPYVPIMLLTGHADLQAIVEARDAGVNEIMVKPVSPAALYQRLINIIERPRPFIDQTGYFGPDRRRRDVVVPAFHDRRSPVSADVRQSFDRLLRKAG